MSRCALPELRVSVQAGTDRGTTDGQLVNTVQSLVYGLQTEINLSDPGTDFLPQCDGRGVLQVGTAGFDNIVELFGFSSQGVTQLAHVFVQAALTLQAHSDVHGRGESVVGGLPTVHVIVGVYGLLTALLAARQFNGAIGDDFVHVHIALGARAGLEHHQREFGIPLASNHFVSGVNNQARQVFREFAQLLVGQSSRFFQDAQRLNHAAAPLEAVAANGEVLDRALRLCAPIVVGGNFNRSHGILFNTCRTHHGSCKNEDGGSVKKWGV